jgi:hypothetical protein
VMLKRIFGGAPPWLRGSGAADVMPVLKAGDST